MILIFQLLGGGFEIQKIQAETKISVLWTTKEKTEERKTETEQCFVEVKDMYFKAIQI